MTGIFGANSNPWIFDPEAGWDQPSRGVCDYRAASEDTIPVAVDAVEVAAAPNFWVVRSVFR